MTKLKALIAKLDHDQVRVEGWDFGDDGAGDCAPAPFTLEHSKDCRRCAIDKEIHNIERSK